MLVGVPFPWALAPTFPPAYSEKELGQLVENGNLEESR